MRSGVLRGFLRAPSGIAGLVTLAMLAALAFLAPVLLGTKAAAYNPLAAFHHPSHAHLLGTDGLGRDILYRLLVATKLSLGLALAASGIGAGIGIPIGVFASVSHARIRAAILRMVDGLLAFPAILIAIFITAIIGTGAFGAVLGVGIALSAYFARIASTLALSIAGRDYIAAARVLGVRTPRLLLRYVLPNVAETLIVVVTVSISSSMVFISSLSFLGLGVQPPRFDWGQMLTQGVRGFYEYPAAALGPAAAILIAAMAFGFAGEALARAMNPVLWAAARPPDKSTWREGTISANNLPSNGYVTTNGGGQNGSHLAGDQTGRSVLEVRDLKVTFGDVEVVGGVSFSLGKGETLGIVGESGSGKTMTALAIARLVSFPGKVAGEVRIDGKDVGALSHKERQRFLATKLALIFQDPMSSLNPALKIGTQMTEARRVHFREGRRTVAQVALSRLMEVHMPAPKRQMARHPHELSGGMRQRISIAQALMCEPTLLIADEPTTALDVTIQAQIMRLLESINTRRQVAVILITHNLALVSQVCSRVLVMYAGQVVEELRAKDLHTGAKHPYTQALLSAVVDITSEDERLTTIIGQMPDPAQLPEGCAFHPRCPVAREICRHSRPVLEMNGDGNRVACWVANEALV